MTYFLILLEVVPEVVQIFFIDKISLEAAKRALLLFEGVNYFQYFPYLPFLLICLFYFLVLFYRAHIDILISKFIF